MLHFPSAYHRRLTWTYFGLFVAIGMTGGLLGPALPHLAQASGSSMSQIAILFTARAVGNMSGAFVTGLLMDRFNGHYVLIGMGILAALGLAIAPLSPLLLLLIGVFMLLGFAEVSLNAGGNTLLLWLHRDAAGPNVSALHFCFSLGNMLTPLLLVAVLSLTGQFHWTFWLVGLAVVSMLWPLSRFSSPTEPTATTNTDQQQNQKYQDPLLLGLFMLLFSLYVGIEITFAGWVAAYGVLTGIPLSQAALLVTLFWLALSAGRLLAIPLLRRYTPWHILCSCLSVGLITAIGLSFSWLPLSLGALLFGLAASAIFPTLYALGNQTMRMRGRTTGAIFIAAGSGALIVPSLTGLLLDAFGEQAFPLLLVSLWLLIGTGLALLALRLRRLSATVTA
ncbi:MFS transporter [Vreelandella zhaodongensis]|uniref:MFS transporter n=1 Tax=Vreelandella zhaodongensis TaxID=1176240 RepID=A0ABX2SV05_VREZH|nr:MFS transporter [Halomonas zhaodongensis]NYS45264.1 MFS transporter [Halomonas zhaodongensis]